MLALLDPSAARQQAAAGEAAAAAAAAAADGAPADDVLEVSEQDVQQWRAVQQADGKQH